MSYERATTEQYNYPLSFANDPLVSVFLSYNETCKGCVFLHKIKMICFLAVRPDE